MDYPHNKAIARFTSKMKKDDESAILDHMSGARTDPLDQCNVLNGKIQPKRSPPTFPQILSLVTKTSFCFEKYITWKTGVSFFLNLSLKL